MALRKFIIFDFQFLFFTTLLLHTPYWAFSQKDFISDGVIVKCDNKKNGGSGQKMERVEKT